MPRRSKDNKQKFMTTRGGTVQKPKIRKGKKGRRH